MQETVYSVEKAGRPNLAAWHFEEQGQASAAVSRTTGEPAFATAPPPSLFHK